MPRFYYLLTPWALRDYHAITVESGK